MGAIESTRRVLETIEGASHRVSASVACGQMHGTVLVGDEGQLAFDSIQLWDDKRPSEEVSAFIATHDVDGLWPIAANPSSVAWPGFKLRWTANHQPESLARAASLLMPKDYVNLRLTGTLGMDEYGASCTYLWDARTGDWSLSSPLFSASMAGFCPRSGRRTSSPGPCRRKPRIQAFRGNSSRSEHEPLRRYVAGIRRVARTPRL